jgi:polysaccharide biosynthesis protein PslG
LAVPARAEPLYGYNDDWQSTVGHQRVGYASDLDSDVIRFTLAWDRVNPEPGMWRWTNTDRLIDAAVAEGLRPLVIAHHAPCWARPSSFENGRCPMDGGWRPDPQFLPQYQTFVEKLVERYPEIVAVEAANEPNLTPWWMPGPEPAYYVRYLKATYQGVKSVRPDLPVLFGGLSPLVRDPVDRVGMAWERFLGSAYRAGAKQWFDGLGFHAYVNPDEYARKLRSQMERIDSLTQNHGDAGVPVWITETGYGTRGSDGVSERRQAAIIKGTYNILSGYDSVQSVIYHRMFDVGSDYYSSMGLVDLDRTLKESYCLVAAWRGTNPAAC